LSIKSHVNNKNWYDNYDKVFGKKKKQTVELNIDLVEAPVIIQEQDSSTFEKSPDDKQLKQKRRKPISKLEKKY